MSTDQYHAPIKKARKQKISVSSFICPHGKSPFPVSFKKEKNVYYALSMIVTKTSHEYVTTNGDGNGPISLLTSHDHFDRSRSTKPGDGDSTRRTKMDDSNIFADVFDTK